jgi:hypothetical protein
VSVQGHRQAFFRDLYDVVLIGPTRRGQTRFAVPLPFNLVIMTRKDQSHSRAKSSELG